MREHLLSYCETQMPPDRRHVKLRHYAENDLIEVRRFEAFFRLYIREDGLFASIRLNTVRMGARFDNRPILVPTARELAAHQGGDHVELDGRLDDIGIRETLTALSEVPYAWEGESYPEYWRRDLWIEDWTRRYMAPAGMPPRPVGRKGPDTPPEDATTILCAEGIDEPFFDEPTPPAVRGPAETDG